MVLMQCRPWLFLGFLVRDGSSADGRLARHTVLRRLRGGAEGMLGQEEAFEFEEARPWLWHVRKHGVAQFISMYTQLRDMESDELKWGDEIEYHIVHLDTARKEIRLSLRAPEVLDALREKEHSLGRRDGYGEACSWHPEYGRWMIEGTPREPYGGYTVDLRRVEDNMRLRRKRLAAVLRDTELAVSMPAFPLMGVGDYTEPPVAPDFDVTQSESVPDGMITPIPRFHALTRNIRQRRGSKVDIRVPLYKDSYTDPVELARGIEMDAMGYGMGCCCLQVTFQARDIDESRHLYDHLAVLAPVMLALTAATPVLKGRLADTDVRWATIAASVDDRTPAERGLSQEHETRPAEQLKELAGGGSRQLPKSRYDSISLYLANCGGCARSYNDLGAPIDEDLLQLLRAGGVDAELAQHVAHLFVRDPLVVRKDRLRLDDAKDTDHFDIIQSTNWQTTRWKPPPKAKAGAPHIGWRVEFRSMEVQLTDFENAAFTVFVVLVSRVILAFGLSLYIPLSKVDENMVRAHARDAVTSEKFWFRKHMAHPLQSVGDADACEEMSVLEILTGKGSYFPGLIPLIFAYLEAIQCDPETLELMRVYMDFIRRRASGQLMTAAQWMRHKVTSHPSYKHDSIVPGDVAFDLVQACVAVAEGRVRERLLLGKVGRAAIARPRHLDPHAPTPADAERGMPPLPRQQWIKPLRTDDAYYVPLKQPSTVIHREEREALLERYASRYSGAGGEGDGTNDPDDVPL